MLFIIEEAKETALDFLQEIVKFLLMCYWMIYHFISIKWLNIIVKLSSSQFNKLKSAIKDETEVLLRSSSNMIGNSDNETNFPHKLLLTNIQVANLHKVFANNYQLILSYQKLNYLKWYIQEDFLVDFLVHY